VTEQAALAVQIDRDLVTALKGQDRTRVATLRLLKAAAKNVEIEKRRPLEEAELLDVIRRQVKLRREAAAEYERAGRTESAEQELAELQILEGYLPAQLPDEDVRTVIEHAIQEASASGPGDLGKVMKLAMPALRGKADGARVNQLARELLAKSR
jgi:uncharacterized protein YqeY